MAFKKVVMVLKTVYFLFNISKLFCIVSTQEVAPPSLTEHIEYQVPTGDDQAPLIHVADLAPTEVQEEPPVVVDQSNPNQVDEALNAVNEPLYAVNQDPVIVNQLPVEGNEAVDVPIQPPYVAVETPIATNEPPNVVNQDVVVNQAVDVPIQPPHVSDDAPIATNEPPNVMNQGVGVNQAVEVPIQQPYVVDEVPFATNEPPNVVNQAASVHNPNVVKQPPRVATHHRASTVEFDFGTVESVELSNEFENVPGVQHEFRIEVAAGKSECIFQRLAENAQLHVSFQVLRGIDRNIEFLIQGPGNLVLEHVQWSGEASFQKIVPFEGLYRFCLNNELSKFTSKLVYFYMVTYIEEKWHEHSKNILDFFGGAEDIQSLDTVDERVKKMHLEQANSRRNVITDWYLIQDNNSYVQTMSLVLCVVIVVSSAFQVFFVRHLFNVKNVKAKMKPRA